MAEGEGAPVTEDRLLGGAVTLLQPATGHRAGTDAVLLAQLAPLRPDDRVADLGSGTGAVGLILARRAPGASVTLVEREPSLVALARRNIAANGLAERVAAVAADLFTPARERAQSGLAPGSVDLAVTNPPFFEAAGAPASPDPGRRSAHVHAGGGLPEWLHAAGDLLAPRGRLALIHRADALALCLDALRRRFGSVAIRPVHPSAGKPASRILLSAVKGGRAPLALLPPLVLHAAGRFTREAEVLHGAPRSVSGDDARRLDERFARGNEAAFLSFLGRDGGAPPRSGDELPDGYRRLAKGR